MIIPVHMFAFSDTRDQVRPVEIDDKWQSSSSTTEVLDEIFKKGQNDFQPRPFPSVSVGDVIEYEIAEGKYWMVLPIGFKKLTQKEFEELNPPTSLMAYKDSEFSS